MFLTLERRRHKPNFKNNLKAKNQTRGFYVFSAKSLTPNDSYLILPIGGVRRAFSSCTSISKGESLNKQDPRDRISNSDFYEYLKGLSDGESNFQFTQDHRGNCSFKFKFRIGMHINDRPLLVYIRNRLGLGKIYPISIESILPEKDKLTSVWEVYYFDDVLKLINIFD